MARTSLPEPSNANEGDIELLGRFPPCALFTTGFPSLSGKKEKSVNWLFKIKPAAIRAEPKAVAILAVIETAFPSLSTTLKCVVDKPCSSISGAHLHANLFKFGLPGTPWPRVLEIERSAARFLSTRDQAAPPLAL